MRALINLYLNDMIFSDFKAAHLAEHGCYLITQNCYEQND